MYTIAVCDTNKHEADKLLAALQKALEELNHPYKYYCYYDSLSLFESLEKYTEMYSCLFLETELSPINGIPLARQLREKGYDGDIVFVSRNPFLIYDAFDVGASQYFLKPVNEAGLRNLFLRIFKKAQQSKKQYLYLNYGAVWHKLRYLDILYIETCGRKVALCTLNHEEPVYYPGHLSDLEKILPARLFIRCHQSFIVQFHAIRSVTVSKLTLIDGTELPISRSYKQNVRAAFNGVEESKTGRG